MKFLICLNAVLKFVFTFLNKMKIEKWKDCFPCWTKKKTSHCSICLSIQKAYPDVWNTRQWRREGGGSRNVTGGDFYPWIIVENWFRFSSSHWTMLRTITRYSIHKLDILGQTNFNYFVKKITFLRIFRFGRFCSVFKVLQLSSWFWFWFDFDLDTCFKWLL